MRPTLGRGRHARLARSACALAGHRGAQRSKSFKSLPGRPTCLMVPSLLGGWDALVRLASLQQSSIREFLQPGCSNSA